jgi:uncharacterized protein (TIGR02996 family)
MRQDGPMNELPAFLEAIRLSKDDDTPRLVFADWLDENHPNPTIHRGELPAGFNEAWNQWGAAYTIGGREPRRRRRNWKDTEILEDFATSANQLGIPWFARAGAAEIGGYPVFVSEPNLSQKRVLRICRFLQWAAGGCPVSFNRCAQRGRVRIAIWFTALPSVEQRMSEVADVMDRLFPVPSTKGVDATPLSSGEVSTKRLQKK